MKNKLSLLIPVLLLNTSILMASLPDGRSEQDPSKVIDTLENKLLTPSLDPSIIELPEVEHSHIIPGADKIFFVLKNIKFIGNTVISDAELNNLYKKNINKKISIPQFQKIASDVTAYYRSKGYILSRAILPEQEISQENGNVKIEIIEGYISEFEIEGDLADKNKKYLKLYGKKLMQDKPLQNINLERYSFLANDLPEADVKVILKPGKGNPGAVKLVFAAECKSYDSFVVVDNYGSRAIGRSSATFSYLQNGILPSSKTGILLKRTRKFKELWLKAIEHGQLLAANGSYFTFRAIKTNVTPDNDAINLSGLNTPACSKSVLFNINHPFIRSQNKNLKGFIEFQGLNSIGYSNGELSFDDKVRSIRTGLNFENHDKYEGTNVFLVELSHGIKGLGANSKKPSREFGKLSYSKFNLNYSRIQLLNPIWTMFFASMGQYSFHQLLSSEQVSFGGKDFGRAYDPSEISGDKGLAGVLEIRYNHRLNPYVFYDLAKVWNLNPNLKMASISSSGLGVRFNFKKLNINTYIGKALTVKVRNEKNRNLRGYFEIRYNLG